MTVFIIHAPQDKETADSLARTIERRGQFVELEDGEMAMRSLGPVDVVVALVSKDFIFSPWRLRLEGRALEAWAEGRLVLVKLDYNFAPIGLRDLPFIDAGFEAQRDPFTWNEVAKRVTEALRPPPAAAAPAPQSPGEGAADVERKRREAPVRPSPRAKRGSGAAFLLGGLALAGAAAAALSIALLFRPPPEVVLEAPPVEQRLPEAAPDMIPPRPEGPLAALPEGASGVVAIAEGRAQLVVPETYVFYPTTPADLPVLGRLAARGEGFASRTRQIVGVVAPAGVDFADPTVPVAVLTLDRAGPFSVASAPALAAPEVDERVGQRTRGATASLLQRPVFEADLNRMIWLELQSNRERTRARAEVRRLTREGAIGVAATGRIDDRDGVFALAQSLEANLAVAPAEEFTPGDPQARRNLADLIAERPPAAAAGPPPRAAPSAAGGLPRWALLALLAVGATTILGALALLWRRKAPRTAASAPAPEAAKEERVVAPPAPAPAQVFISYARVNTASVSPLAKAIAENGRKVWIDTAEIGGGDGWAGEIVRAIKGAAHVVVMCSTAAFESDHVKREVYLADRYKKRLLPVYLEAAEPPEDFEYFFAGVQPVALATLAEPERPAAVLKALSL